jgi:hypothetical protein
MEVSSHLHASLPPYKFDWRLGGPQTPSQLYGKSNNLLILPRIYPQFHGCLARSPSLYRLSYPRSPCHTEAAERSPVDSSSGRTLCLLFRSRLSPLRPISTNPKHLSLVQVTAWLSFRTFVPSEWLADWRGI